MKKILRWVLPGVLVLLLDRGTKLWLDGVDSPLIPGIIKLTPAHNTGMALGLFQGNALGILAFSAVLILAAVFLARDMSISGLAPIALSMIAGGALGNMIDRAAYGYVIDMFDFQFVRFYIFNAADAGVVIGAVLCGISLLFRPRDWRKKK